jgi:acyl-[acyl carrier protein]--UDP-N-acetylglucosamine O-acyltransferase
MSAVLITNIQLAWPTGTEIVVRDLARGLRRRGHDVAVYAPLLGDPAQRLAAEGVTVVADIDDVLFEPDVIHGHHHTPTITALERFSGVPAIWVCHDREQYEDIPPRHLAIRHYVAVDLNCRERLVQESGIPADQVSVVHNAVDLDRYPQRGTMRDRPRRALVFSNQARPGTYLDIVKSACESRGVELDVIGLGVGVGVDDPERLIAGYDLVFAKARCAIESLVSGCAVILADQVGLGRLVTTENVNDLRDWNFGSRTLARAHDVDSVGREIDAIDPEDVAAVSDHMRKFAGLEQALDAYESLYREVRRSEPESNTPGLSPLAAALSYAALLERRVRRSGTALSTVPLPASAVDQVHLRVNSQVPAVVACDAAFGVDVIVTNGSREVLSSEPTKPVHVAYHWRHPNDSTLDVLEGDRTVLGGPIHPGAELRVRLRVVAPSVAAGWRLQITLVQESVMWFDAVDATHAVERRVSVGDESEPRIRLGHLVQRLDRDARSGVELVRDCAVDTLCFLDDPLPGALTFVASRTLVSRLDPASGVAAVITSPDLARSIPNHLGLVIAPDPVAAFYAIHNDLAANSTFYGEDDLSHVDRTAIVHPSSMVAARGVEIGPDCVIGPGVVIEGRVRIGPRTRLDAGTVIGATAFQRSGPTHGDINMIHVGSVDIGADCHIHANAVIARGQLAVPTVIGDRTYVGNGAFVSHRCRIGSGVSIGHNATVNGRVLVGDGAWVGPGAVISNYVELGAGCRVTLGATVLRDVAPGEEVSGLPAMRKHEMFRHAASIKRPR